MDFQKKNRYYLCLIAQHHDVYAVDIIERRYIWAVFIKEKKMIFITLGSQKFQFDRLLKEVDKLVGEQFINQEVFAQIGYSKYKPKNFAYKDFLDRSEFARMEEKSEIVITHGGTGAIIGALKKGKKVIAVPRLARFGEHVDDHQLQLIINGIQIAKNEVPDIKCYLAGDGEIDKIKELVKQKKLEDNIEVIGWADFDKKLKLLKETATIVLPSYNEGLPMAILEGMASAKGIISTMVGAIPEVVGNENGILIEPGDTNKLAEALVKYSKDVEFLCSSSKANIKKIEEQFSMTFMHKKLMQYYDELL